MFERVRILVVDDEPDMCWALCSVLRFADYDVTMAVSAAEALALARDAPFSVAFVDAKLPDMDGQDLATVFRQISPRMAIILMSGYYYREDPAVADGLLKGLYTSFLAKPFDLAQVRQAAQRAVEISRK
jgi:DNA-binding NtrC family response regulator